jgi:hypothetical protein
MKKSLILVCVFALLLGGTACTKKENSNDSETRNLSLNNMQVQEGVRGWSIYTNPAYRYELRFPKNWKTYDSGEDGKQSAFYPASREGEVKASKETYYGTIVILSKSNWKENYNLEEFYREQTENLFLGGYEQEEILLGGKAATWFKDVRNRNPEKPEAVVDIITFDLEDRIIEVEIHEKQFWDDVKVIMNSIKFYPSKVKADLQVK